MSIVVSWDVFCDGPGCSQWTDGPVGHQSTPRPAFKARQMAAKNGWARRGKRDLCPHCMTQIKKRLQEAKHE